jgi:hypothetical protein
MMTPLPKGHFGPALFAAIIFAPGLAVGSKLAFHQRRIAAEAAVVATQQIGNGVGRKNCRTQRLDDALRR